MCFDPKKIQYGIVIKEKKIILCGKCRQQQAAIDYSNTFIYNKLIHIIIQY